MFSQGLLAPKDKFPPWIYPPENYTPWYWNKSDFIFTATGLNLLDTFKTPSRFVRVATIGFKTPSGNFPFFLFDGSDMYMIPNFNLFARPLKSMEAPVFFILPPNRVIKVFINGSLGIGNRNHIRATGWEFDYIETSRLP